jgi:hypothetical protein
MNMSCSSSVTTIIVGERLPWPDDASAPDQDGPLDAGAITVCGSRQPCSIRKISALGVTVASELTPPLGERACVELETGQRAAGKVAWTGRKELGVRFDDSIDVIALVNRKLVSQERERRTMPRLQLRATVHLKCSGQFWPATLRNISSRGLQIEADALPPEGAYVAAFVEGLNIPAGEIVWRRGKVAGIELIDELSWSSIVPWVRSLVKHRSN